MRFAVASRLLLSAFLLPPLLRADTAPNYAQERAEMARNLTAPFDWFSLVALQWLKPGTTTVGSAPDNTLVLAGAPAHLLTLEQQNGSVTVRQADPSLRLNGSPVPAGTILNGEADSDALSTGTLRLWAIDRSGARYLRVKDSNAPARLHFRGLSWYAPNPSYRITARWIPYPTPHSLTTRNQIGQTYTTPLPGYIEFSIDGTTQRLYPFSASDENGLFFVFRDATYRTTTYGGGRFLETAKPSAGVHQPGTVVIDFNEAYDPPCAYTPYATCPLASPENRLAIPIPAGEKQYAEEADEPHASASRHP